MGIDKITRLAPGSVQGFNKEEKPDQIQKEAANLKASSGEAVKLSLANSEVSNQAKVDSLKASIGDGSYNVSSKDVASAITRFYKS
jgi:flagellar biosynthesis anti-sigma factor FlgM